MGVVKGCFLLLTAILICCQATSLKWWQAATFYQIYPRSFKDSDGDGVGDLKGVAQQLPYLKEIGIEGAWLSPIFTSPMADFGYDISNFTEIEPLFGSMADFEELVEQANKTGIKVILDFVPNHTSDECEWFKKSAANDSYYKDFFIWHPGHVVNGTRRPPNNWISVFRGSMWEWHEGRQSYYLHQFHHSQPDLNFRNPVVVETMKNVLRFWLRKGIAGFRIDSVPHLFEVAADSEGNYPDEPLNTNVNDTEDYEYHRHTYTKNLPENFDLIYQFRQTLEEMKTELGQKDEFILMTEGYNPLHINMQFYGNSTQEGAQIPFNFELMRYINNQSTAHDYERHIYDWLNNMPNNKTANWLMGNHDNKRVGSRLGRDRIDVINMLISTLPGCSITYQGEEIGMTDVWISWKDSIDPQACGSNPENYERLTRDPARTPFQWSDEPFAGFTNGSSTWLPVAPNYKLVNVKRERGIPQSHLNIYKKLKKLRRHPTFQQGGVEVKALNDDILAVQRSLHKSSTYIILLNFGNKTENFNLRKEFPHLTAKLKYEVVTSKSDKREGDIVNTQSVSVQPHEAVVLEAI